MAVQIRPSGHVAQKQALEGLTGYAHIFKTWHADPCDPIVKAIGETRNMVRQLVNAGLKKDEARQVVSTRMRIHTWKTEDSEALVLFNTILLRVLDEELGLPSAKPGEISRFIKSATDGITGEAG